MSRIDDAVRVFQPRRPAASEAQPTPWGNAMNDAGPARRIRPFLSSQFFDSSAVTVSPARALRNSVSALLTLSVLTLAALQAPMRAWAAEDADTPNTGAAGNGRAVRLS